MNVHRRDKSITSPRVTAAVLAGFTLLVALIVTAGTGAALSNTGVPVYTDWSAPVNLGPIVNSAVEPGSAPASTGSDYAAALTPDELSLYFMSNRLGGSGGRDLWVSQRPTPGSAWGAPVNLGPTINSPVNDENPAFSADGHWLFFGSLRPGGLGDLDIWKSYRADVHDDFGWQAPVNLGPPVNTPLNDNSPNYFANPGGAPQLFFGSGPIPGQFGLRDLQVSTLQPDGSWGPPAWLPELSSIYTDNGSTVRSDGLEIIFHRGTVLVPQAQTDMWSATRASVDDPWSAPVNLGGTVNVPVITDEEPFLTADGKTLYFDSNRPGGIGGFDIYMSTREQVLPATKDDCKNDGWERFGVFENQGDCVSYVATGGSNAPG